MLNKKVYYSAYNDFDSNNGHGIRNTIFFSGCPHKCHNCFNKSTWNYDNGLEYDKNIEDRIINDLKNKEYLDGLSILGGEPLDINNFEAVLKLCKRVKKETNKTIWIWTGYKINHIKKDYRKVIFDYIDVIVDGLFVESLKSNDLVFKGSSNQNIYLIKNGNFINIDNQQLKEKGFSYN